MVVAINIILIATSINKFNYFHASYKEVSICKIRSLESVQTLLHHYIPIYVRTCVCDWIFARQQSSWLINIKTRFKITKFRLQYSHIHFDLFPLQTFISSKQSTIQSNAKSINPPRLFESIIIPNPTNRPTFPSVPNLEQKDQQQSEKNEKILARGISLSWREKFRRESRPVSRLVIIEGIGKFLAWKFDSLNPSRILLIEEKKVGNSSCSLIAIPTNWLSFIRYEVDRYSY